MAWGDLERRVAVKAIGTVESNMKFDVIYYVDPITVGIAQWFGTRAANLLNQIKATAGWSGVAPSLEASLAAYPETSSYWNNRHLTGAEGASLSVSLRSNEGRMIQVQQFFADIESYRGPALQRGLNAETHPQSFIYYANLYHQSPLNANRVLNTAGSNPSLDRLYTLALNNTWYRKFPTRQKRVRDIILAMDDDINVEFNEQWEPEQGGDPSDSGDEDRFIELLNSVMLVGNSIHLQFGNGNTVICPPTNNRRLWLPGKAIEEGPLISDSTPPDIDENEEHGIDPSSPAAAKAQALVNFLKARINKYNYSQGAGRDRPDQSGVADCSSTVNYAYRQIMGWNIGANTVEQCKPGKKPKYGTQIFNGVNPSRPGQYPPSSFLLPGDLLYFSNDRTFQRVRHVEMYIGGGELIGHGVPSRKGPFIKPNYNSYMSYWRWHVIQRPLTW